VFAIGVLQEPCHGFKTPFNNFFPFIYGHFCFAIEDVRKSVVSHFGEIIKKPRQLGTGGALPFYSFISVTYVSFRKTASGKRGFSQICESQALRRRV
jgi:hypothetical protein